MGMGFAPTWFVCMNYHVANSVDKMSSVYFVLTYELTYTAQFCCGLQTVEVTLNGCL